MGKSESSFHSPALTWDLEAREHMVGKATQPHPLTPIQTLRPLLWVLLTATSAPHLCQQARPGLLTCGAALLSRDLFVSRTALVADDSARRHTHAQCQAGLPSCSRVICPLWEEWPPVTRKGNDR